jgi:hypothetical protein
MPAQITKRIHRAWREFRDAQPGERFQHLHARRARRRGRSPLRYVALVAGFVLMAAGLILMPAPGPGAPIVAIGGVLAARESRAMAKALDWCELKARALGGRARQWWRRAA